MYRRVLMFSWIVLGSSVAFGQTTIVDDDFESYTSQADLLNAWPTFGHHLSPADPVVFITDTNGDPLDNSTMLISEPHDFYGRPAMGEDPEETAIELRNVDGQAAEFCGSAQGSTNCPGAFTGGGTVNRWGTPFNISPSATENIVLQGDIGDDALSANKRLTIALRNTVTSENILEMGLYNDPVPGFNYRAQIFQVGGESNPNWVNFNDETLMDQALPEGIDSQSAVGSGFHTFKAVIGVDSIVFTLDIYGDGLANELVLDDPNDPEGPSSPVPGVGTPGVDAMDTVFVVTTAAGFDDLRFGIPSHLPSSGGGNIDAAFAAFDNISLKLVPIEEPTGNADFDSDDLVDGADFLTWQVNFPLLDGTGQRVDGDATGEGNIDADDLGVWQTQFGTNPNAAAAAGVVPEPSAVVMSIAALATCGFIRRRQ